MASQVRKNAADAEMGRRHPVATLYGGLVVGLGAAVVAVVLLAVAWQHRPAWHLPSRPGGSHPALLLLLLIPVALYLWLSPARRLNRQIRRVRR